MLAVALMTALISGCNGGGDGGGTPANQPLDSTSTSSGIPEKPLLPSDYLLHMSDDKGTLTALVDPDASAMLPVPKTEQLVTIMAGEYDDVIGGVRNARTDSLVYISGSIARIPLRKSVVGVGTAIQVSSQPAISKARCASIAFQDFANPLNSKYMYLYADDCIQYKNSVGRVTQIDAGINDAPLDIPADLGLLGFVRSPKGALTGYIVHRSGVLLRASPDFKTLTSISNGIFSLTSKISAIMPATTSRGVFIQVDSAIRYLDLVNNSVGPVLYTIPAGYSRKDQVLDDSSLYLLNTSKNVYGSWSADVVRIPLSGDKRGNMLNSRSISFAADSLYPIADYVLVRGARYPSTTSAYATPNGYEVDAVKKLDGAVNSLITTYDFGSSINLVTSVRSNLVFYSYPKRLLTPGFSVKTGVMNADGRSSWDWPNTLITGLMSDTYALGYKNVDRFIRYQFDENGTVVSASSVDVLTAAQTPLGNPGISLGSSGRTFVGADYGKQTLVSVAEGYEPSKVYDYLLFDTINQRNRRLSYSLK